MEGILCFFIRQMRKNRIYRLTQQTLRYTTEQLTGILANNDAIGSRSTCGVPNFCKPLAQPCQGRGNILPRPWQDGAKAVAPNRILESSNLNEDPENIYSIYYPTVASRVVESKVPLTIENREEGYQTLYLKPLDPGIVFEKIIVDFGGYEKSFLFMDESPSHREK